jgi:hypothetical protein
MNRRMTPIRVDKRRSEDLKKRKFPSQKTCILTWDVCALVKILKLFLRAIIKLPLKRVLVIREMLYD